MREGLIKLVVSLGLFAVAHFASAQYISGVTRPDDSQPLEVDMSLPQVRWASDITSGDLYDHLSVLASDEYEGRETGKPGNDQAAQYIRDHFKSLGLEAPVEGSYFQPIAFTSTMWDDMTLSVNGNSYRHLWDYLAMPSANHNMNFTTDEVMFLGYGIDDNKYSDYKGKNVKDKVVMIYKSEPKDADGKSYITGSEEMSEWTTDPNKKLAKAKEKGAKLVLIIEDELKEILFKNRKYLLNGRMMLGDLTKVDLPTANHIYISSDIAKDIIGAKSKKFKKLRKCIEKRGKAKALPLKSDLKVNMDRKLTVLKGNNVLGLIRGSEKPDEIVVVSAHYDHLGKKGDDVWNGADDNGSGTSTVLDIAESFAKAAQDGHPPKRSILFLLATGEEKGLLGSEYYAENPIFPLKNTVVDVNVDMVGRVDKRYEDNPNYIYVIGSDRLSSDLHVINERVNQQYTQLVLDYKYNDEKDPNRYYYRSDHYNFASRGIPAIFFFNGTHDDYHQITDTVDKINFDKMSRIGQHIFHLTWELANRNQRIQVLKD